MKRLCVLTVAWLLCLSDSASAYQIGVFRPSTGAWYLDTSGDNAWTPGTDLVGSFGIAGDWPLAHRFTDPPPQTQILVLRNRCTWFMSFNDFFYEPTDPTFTFPNAVFGARTIPVSWNGHLVAFESGSWFVDANDSRGWDGADTSIRFGTAGDFPVVGRWGSNSVPQRMGIVRTNPPDPMGYFYLDSNGDNTLTAADVPFPFGYGTDIPFAADFNPATPGDEIGVFRGGVWYIDFNGNHSWDDTGGGDKIFIFGGDGDIPVVAQQQWMSSSGGTSGAGGGIGGVGGSGGLGGVSP